MLLCEIIFQLIEDMIEVTIVRIVPNYAIMKRIINGDLH